MSDVTAIIDLLKKEGKIMRKILFTMLIMAILACPVVGALTQKQIQFVDEFGRAVNIGTSVSLFIYNVGTTTQQTCYTNRTGSSAYLVTQAITDDSANTPLDYTTGLMTFWSTTAGYKLLIYDGVSERYIDNLDGSDTRIYWPSTLGDIARGLTFTENTDRTGEGTYLFANGLPIGMATPGDSQGMKMEFDYGVEPTVTGSGKTITGLIVKNVMDYDWTFSSSNRNAVVRGAMLHAESSGTVGGRVQGAYINAKAQGTTETITGTFAVGATSIGLMAIEARTELGTNCALTTPRVAGLLCFHNQKTGSSLTGEYAAIQIDQPLTGTMTGDKYGIYFTDDHVTGYPFQYAFGFDSNLDLDTVAHYEADQTAAGMSFSTVDGWISVDIDGHQLYLYLWDVEP